MRAEVLAILRKHGGPLSAYDILDALRPAHPKIAPPTVYRALAALTDGGDVHRLESLNAFMACRGQHHDHASIMSICDDCGSVDESTAPELMKELSTIAEKFGFEARRHVIEVHGVCATCGGEETSR